MDQSLADLLRTCNAILESRLDGELPRGAREHILGAFSDADNRTQERETSYNSIGYRRRMLLHIVTVQQMLPVWDFFKPDDLSAHVYFNLGFAIYAGLLPRSVGDKILIEEENLAFFGNRWKLDLVRRLTAPYGIDLVRRDISYLASTPNCLPGLSHDDLMILGTYAPIAVERAASAMAIHVSTGNDPAPSEHALTWDDMADREEGDVAYNLATAYSYIDLDESWIWNVARRHAFWKWWLNEAVPFAYFASRKTFEENT